MRRGKTLLFQNFQEGRDLDQDNAYINLSKNLIQIRPTDLTDRHFI